MTDENTCISFPCEYPLKVMGLNSELFSSAVHAILDKHIRPGAYVVTRRLSSGNKYLSLSVTFTAGSKEQLDALYEELNAHDLVLMTL